MYVCSLQISLMFLELLVLPPQLEHCRSRPTAGIASLGISYSAVQLGQISRIFSPV